ncbi:prepilin-type N-terminal cleavage/methylation domain-containing protein [Moritella marina ATCC 15381]|uniref:Prepilin-type N-terminal cleavage/methylation domain-containing protein n=1 Tax=Moritella marina ATCC 15381 TaxID=1202962 RepID=A0A5J6WPL6_MORMI|nr:prepilin-type N-terminal cleavage/methylation domain-containing protein [Moritella marina]QFI39118.1 prepilin-type N-terminal cleavage/methylation domain-containing protein [Moritella marina ATCC 15381]
MQSRKDSGFSLIEVMVTSLILAVGLLGIVALQGIAKKSLADTDKQIQAAFLARTALEELRADTRWLTATSSSSPSQDSEISDILTNAANSAALSNMAICRNVAGTVTIAVSWQIQNTAAASGAVNGAACGLAIDNRRQVVLTSLISEAI